MDNKGTAMATDVQTIDHAANVVEDSTANIQAKEIRANVRRETKDLYESTYERTRNVEENREDLSTVNQDEADNEL